MVLREYKKIVLKMEKEKIYDISRAPSVYSAGWIHI